jgi:hypothetical protein
MPFTGNLNRLMRIRDIVKQRVELLSGFRGSDTCHCDISIDYVRINVRHLARWVKCIYWPMESAAESWARGPSIRAQPSSAGGHCDAQTNSNSVQDGHAPGSPGFLLSTATTPEQSRTSKDLCVKPRETTQEFQKHPCKSEDPSIWYDPKGGAKYGRVCSIHKATLTAWNRKSNVKKKYKQQERKWLHLCCR